MIAGIIIAKKESRRLPNKNIRDFCGLPLVAWSIIQSKCSKLIDETYLSTDSDEIAQIGEDLGAEIIWRDYEIKDYCANVAFAHAIRKIRETKLLETVITILPTSPASPPDQYDEMIRAFNREGVKDMVLTAPLDEQVEKNRSL
jgi:CMP-N-acetylneuraminic acid synthetase